MENKLEHLKEYLKGLGSVAVAFSSGVDSTFLLKVAHDVLGDKAIAITAQSCSFPKRELNEAKAFCEKEGIQHVICQSEELEIEGFSKNPRKTIYQSAILLPFLMSIVIVSYITFAFFSGDNGMLNKTILPFFGKEAINWYSESKYWPVILVIVNTWKGVGYGCLIYIYSIYGIDPSFYEAAELDGASKWKQIRYITLPSIMPSVFTLTLLNIGRIFYSDFGLFYQVTQNSGQLYDTTNVIDTYVYRALLQSGNIGMASAAGFYQSIVGFACVLLANVVVRKLSPENAMF